VNTGYEMKGIDYQVFGDSIDLWCCGFNGSFIGCIYKARIAEVGTGIRESRVGSCRTGARSLPTVIRRLPAGAVAFDAMGRRVRNLRSGIFFVREPPAVGGKRSAVTKVIITR
jgi:hypothetical protein